MAEVLAVQMQPDGQRYFSSSPLRRSSPSQNHYIGGSPSKYSSHQAINYSQVDCQQKISSPIASPPSSYPPTSHADFSNPPSFGSTPTSSISLDTKYDQQEEISFPSYNDVGYLKSREDLEPPPSPVTDNSYTVPSSTTSSGSVSPRMDQLPISEDDTAVREEPSRHVDYLSHEWREEDIWSSWRHIVSNRALYGERSRLENASWRTWAKTKWKLKTVSPEKLNWFKDCDVTWLYGPLQTSSSLRAPNASESCSNLSKNNSFLTKKPILKKRSASEVMLQKSLSSSSLVMQAAAAVQAQQGNSQTYLPRRPQTLKRNTSDFIPSDASTNPTSRDTVESLSSRSTSGLHSPESEKKHIRFDDNVEQCIAVDKEGEDDEDEDDWAVGDDDSSSDDSVILMKTSKRRRPSNPIRRRSNSTSDSKTIAKLPSTTLKYRTDTPDPPGEVQAPNLAFWSAGRISPSSSQETLRPTRPNGNFLTGEDEPEEDISWEPSGAFAGRRDSLSVRREGNEGSSAFRQEESDGSSNGLRRTPSGMFMPYDDEDDDYVPTGVFGRVMDTVNTAKDIAHVIWNVGWR